MAIYTTYFVGRDAQIAAALPDSRGRLVTPVKAVRVNPFTKKKIEVISFDPADAPGNPVMEVAQQPLPAFPQYAVIAIRGDYLQYLEERLPPGVRSLPHLAWKSMDSMALVALAEALGMPEPDALFEAHAGLRFLDGATLDEVPPVLVTALSSLENRRATAERWVEDEQLEGESPDDVLPFLDGLCALARLCRDGAKLALLTEW